ncbi:membrane protein [Longispora fulva]|uniref:Heme O synthase-like polyprenyltransferase n=1 Tax=Longispora fulva TaxID=619741 RepID=A0A8J7GER7_9ACTN|nr:DUF6328 family protein [Longispora fulva]MBG6135187.1 heme O synthase-like polyprenyltransferase [Longispora fulva]GIG56578.1 membrane protein [Longispora fulva]
MVESESDRAKRNFDELLQELRVAQTGNQILFAFLLTVAFTPRFAQATGPEKFVYVLTVLSASAATALFIAPVNHHRLTFRRGMKSQILPMSSHLAIAGLFFMMLALNGALYLAVRTVVGAPWAGIATGLIATTYVVLWYGVPLIRRIRGYPPQEP